MNFNKSNLKTLRVDITAALDEVAKKHGIDLSIGNISFSANEFTTKLTAKGSDNKTENAEMDFQRGAIRIGIKSEAYGKHFTLGGDTFKLVGINTRAKKYPLLGINGANGKTYKLPVSMLIGSGFEFNL